MINFKDLTDKHIDSLLKHTFVVAETKNGRTIIHKNSRQYKERIMCVPGVDCPKDLTRGEKVALNINSKDEVRFERVPALSKSTKHRLSH